MNGPVKMYSMRQIIDHGAPVHLSNVMYQMKNIHSSRNGVVDRPADHVPKPTKKLDISDQNNQEIPGMAELVVRQEEILKQLAELRKQIFSIKADLKISAGTGSKVAERISCARSNVATHLPDIVVNASPTNPPYSLEILQRLLSDDVSLAVTSHLHSTVASLPKPAEELSKILVNFNLKPKVPVMNVRLIWKNIESNTELLVSHVPILGEVNLLRYLSRTTGARFGYDCVTTDSLLDACYLLARSKTKTERNALYQTLMKSLGKGQYLGGRDEIGIVDIAAYSAIRQCGSSNDLNVTLGKWYQRCEARAV